MRLLFGDESDKTQSLRLSLSMQLDTIFTKLMGSKLLSSRDKYSFAAKFSA